MEGAASGQTDLRLLYGGIKSVAHWRNVQTRPSLLVSLLEELLHDSVHPELVGLQRLGGVGEVGTVDHVL